MTLVEFIMGLDVSGYKNIRQVMGVNPDDEDDYVTFYDARMGDQFEGLFENVHYDGEYVDGPSFSCSGYNLWRDQLAALAGYPKEPFDTGYAGIRVTHCAACWNGVKGPFSEQINFSDVEGTFGPAASLKLSLDYIAYEAQAKAVGGFFYESYLKFKHVFTETAGHGAVKFS